MASAQDWIWVPSYSMYFSPSASLYAKPNPATGEWEYQGVGESSSSGSNQAAATAEANQGGIGNVGWGLLIDDDQLAKVGGGKAGGEEEVEEGEIRERTPGDALSPDDQLEKEVQAYNDSLKYAYDPTPSSSSSNHILAAPSINRPSPIPTILPTQQILRLVVLNSKILGTNEKVAIIDSRPGGFEIGRDKSFKPRVRLKEMEVSKVHACVFWGDGKGAVDDEGEEGFWVVDTGSTHGSFLLDPDQSTNPHRLSESRKASRPHLLYHLSRLTIGTTTFEAHLHPSWPCDACALTASNTIQTEEPSQSENRRLKSRDAATSGSGQIVSPVPLIPGDWKQTEERRVAMTAQAKRDDTDRRSRLAMKNLKASYFGEEEAEKKHWKDGVGSKKRKEKPNGGVDSGWGGARPNQKRKIDDRPDPALALSTPLSAQNKGCSMLVKAGWAPGSGLGAEEGSGRTESIVVHATDGMAGIGSKKMKDLGELMKAGDGTDWREKAKERRWYEAQKE